MEVIELILKIVWFILALSYSHAYEKTDKVTYYIGYWGCMILAILS